MNPRKKYKLWIEAECWSETWNPEDVNTDVKVVFDDGSSWVASFFTYKNIETLVKKNQHTGECLSGTYFWSSDMILIDKVERKKIREVIDNIIERGYLNLVFSQCDDEDTGDEIQNDIFQ